MSTLSQTLPRNYRVRVDNHANLFAAVNAKLGRNCRRRHRCEYFAPVWGAFKQCWQSEYRHVHFYNSILFCWGFLAPTQLRVVKARSVFGWIQRELTSSLAKNATKPLKSYYYRPKGRRTIGRPKKLRREQLLLRRRNRSKGPILDDYDNDDGGKSLPYFFNHDQQQIFCSVYGSITVNYHNVVAEDIPILWQKTER